MDLLNVTQKLIASHGSWLKHEWKCYLIWYLLLPQCTRSDLPGNPWLLRHERKQRQHKRRRSQSFKDWHNSVSQVKSLKKTVSLLPLVVLTCPSFVVRFLLIFHRCQFLSIATSDQGQILKALRTYLTSKTGSQTWFLLLSRQRLQFGWSWAPFWKQQREACGKYT